MRPHLAGYTQAEGVHGCRGCHGDMRYVRACVSAVHRRVRPGRWGRVLRGGISHARCVPAPSALILDAPIVHLLQTRTRTLPLAPPSRHTHTRE